jgi:hypothetical protein
MSLADRIEKDLTDLHIATIELELLRLRSATNGQEETKEAKEEERDYC